MQGLKIKCKNCGRIDFETTDKFDINIPPNGSMVKCLLPYQIDWLCSSTTLASEMTCPECLAPLVIGGFLNVVIPIREAGKLFQGWPEIVSEMPWKSQIAAMNAKDNVPGATLGGGSSVSRLDTEIKTSPSTPKNEAIKPLPIDTSAVTETEQFMDDIKEKFICDVCGKDCKNQFGLNSHKRSHKPGGRKKQIRNAG